MDRILQLWPLWTLVLVGLGFFLWNLKSAIGGWRRMRSLDRQHKAHLTTRQRYKQLLTDLNACKQEFMTKAAALSETRRKELWLPVESHTLAAIKSLLGNDTEKAMSDIEQAIVAGRQAIQSIGEPPKD